MHPSSIKVDNHGQYSSSTSFDICLAYLAKKARNVITFLELFTQEFGVHTQTLG